MAVYAYVMDTLMDKVVYQQRQRHHKVADSFSHGFSQIL